MVSAVTEDIGQHNGTSRHAIARAARGTTKDMDEDYRRTNDEGVASPQFYS